MTAAAVALWVCFACGSVLGLYDASVAMIRGDLYCLRMLWSSWSVVRSVCVSFCWLLRCLLLLRKLIRAFCMCVCCVCLGESFGFGFVIVVCVFVGIGLCLVVLPFVRGVVLWCELLSGLAGLV